LRPIYHYASLGGETIRDLIFYEYAKLIARSAGFAGNYAFIVKKYTELREGRLAWSNLTREHRKELERGKSCAYCGSPRNIGFHHIIPLERGHRHPRQPGRIPRLLQHFQRGPRPLRVVGKHPAQRRRHPSTHSGEEIPEANIRHTQGTLDSTHLDGDGKLTVLDLGAVLGTQMGNTPSTQANKPAITPHTEENPKRETEGV